MDREDGKDLRVQAHSLRRTLLRRASFGRSPGGRSRLRLILLLLVVIPGGLLLGAPRLRGVLRERVEVLRDAYLAGGAGIRPLRAQVGENTQPIPPEYLKPAPPIFPSTGIQALAGPTYSTGGGYPSETWIIRNETGSPTPSAGVLQESPSGSSVEPEYRQGALEREAYNLLLQGNKTLDGLVKGEVAELHFKHWSAAMVAEGKYLVRVVFTRDSEPTERAYIWSVDLAAKDVIALSAYARSISR